MANDFLNVGGFNANVNAKQINFSDGTVQSTAATTGGLIFDAGSFDSGPFTSLYFIDGGTF
jgi:hypothetical protein